MKEYVMQLEEAMVSDDGEVCIKSKAVKELIRCKDCAWHSGTQFCKNFDLIGMYDDDFCSCAERKKK